MEHIAYAPVHEDGTVDWLAFTLYKDESGTELGKGWEWKKFIVRLADDQSE